MDEVTDPTDFPSTHDSLRNLDEALRCPICKDLVRAPVMLTGCGHSFCSQCVRESLNLQEECPQCRVKARGDHIVKNTALEGVVIAYGKARNDILALVKDQLLVQQYQQRQQERLLERFASESPRKKRKIEVPSSSSDLEEIEELPSPPAWELASPSKRKGKGKLTGQSTHSASSASINASRRTNQSGAGGGPSVDHSESGKEVGLIQCPQCDELVDYAVINQHLDSNCTLIPTAPAKRKASGEEGKRAWQNIFSGAGGGSTSKKNASSAKSNGNGNSTGRQASPFPERLPKEAYDTLKDKQLRERLARFDLSTTGSRAKMQARHERWVVLYNSNFQDQAPENRKTLKALRADLLVWEKEREKDEKERAKAMERAANGGSKENGPIGLEYEMKHGAQFRTLIEQARATAAKARSGAKSAEDPVTIADSIGSPGQEEAPDGNAMDVEEPEVVLGSTMDKQLEMIDVECPADGSSEPKIERAES
ncbi:E3 ubiquitin-protein ligase rad18 [Tulasnella sp. 417]|nr:E3 ubiquitin-protein ligase rad18 [Tulasnella sp. 417]